MTLLPVIGLVQVGAQAMADRYSYFSLIGIFVAAAFSAQALAGRFSFLKPWLAAAGVVTLGASLLLTERQLRYWHDSQSLFTHTLEVEDSRQHTLIWNGILQSKRVSEAVEQFVIASKPDPLNPEYELAYSDAAGALDAEGKPDLAALNYREAVKRNPRSAVLHDDYGFVLAELGRFDEALEQFSAAAQLDAASVRTHFLMGKCLLQLGRNAEAVASCRRPCNWIRTIWKYSS